MTVTVKKIVLWRKEVENRTGILANALAPLAHAGTDIHVVMGYRYPGHESKAAIELYPVTGRKSVIAAHEAGFSASAIPALLVEGDKSVMRTRGFKAMQLFLGLSADSRTASDLFRANRIPNEQRTCNSRSTCNRKKVDRNFFTLPLLC